MFRSIAYYYKLVHTSVIGKPTVNYEDFPKRIEKFLYQFTRVSHSVVSTNMLIVSLM